MTVACGAHAAGRRPRPGRRIIQFCTAQSTVIIGSSGHQHLAIGQQRRSVPKACGAEAARCHPHPTGRIIAFRAAQEAITVLSARHQHLARRQQRRSVIVTCSNQAASHCPTRINHYRIAQPVCYHQSQPLRLRCGFRRIQLPMHRIGSECAVCFDQPRRFDLHPTPRLVGETHFAVHQFHPRPSAQLA